MRVVICWPEISGYMAACWRELASRAGFDLTLVAFRAEGAASFTDELVKDLPCGLLAGAERNDAPLVASFVRQQQPDILVIPGWAFPAYSRLAFDPALAATKIVLALDTPLRRDLRQRIARWRLRAYLARASRVIVPGERGFQYARFLGIEERRIRRGVYGVDVAGFSEAYVERTNRDAGWPRQFVYAGRYAVEKGIDVLMEGYARYRKLSRQPWGLWCCGRGSQADLLRSADGVEDLGFVQPNEQARLYARCGAFVMVSRYDPWPLAIVEACAAGLPVVCSEACGSAVEVVRACYNGQLVATGDPDALAAGLLWVDRSHETLSVLGRRSLELAAPYSAAAWATRWSQMFAELAAGG